MKRIISLALILGLLTACGSNPKQNVGMANPLVQYTTVEEAAKAAGVKIVLPEFPDGTNQKSIVVINSTVLEVAYSTSDGEIVYRATRSTELSSDISGVYNDFENVENITENSIEFVLKGDGDNISIVLWQNGKNTYSLYFNPSMPKDDVLKIISKIKNKL